MPSGIRRHHSQRDHRVLLVRGEHGLVRDGDLAVGINAEQRVHVASVDGIPISRRLRTVGDVVRHGETLGVHGLEGRPHSLASHAGLAHVQRCVRQDRRLVDVDNGDENHDAGRRGPSGVVVGGSDGQDVLVGGLVVHGSGNNQVVATVDGEHAATIAVGDGEGDRVAVFVRGGEGSGGHHCVGSSVLRH